MKLTQEEIQARLHYAKQQHSNALMCQMVEVVEFLLGEPPVFSALPLPPAAPAADVLTESAELTRLRTAIEHVRQQAGIWKQEARTQGSIVKSILETLGLPTNDWEAETNVAEFVAGQVVPKATVGIELLGDLCDAMENATTEVWYQKAAENLKLAVRDLTATPPASKATTDKWNPTPGDNFGSAEHWKEKAQDWASYAEKLRKEIGGMVSASELARVNEALEKWISGVYVRHVKPAQTSVIPEATAYAESMHYAVTKHWITGWNDCRDYTGSASQADTGKAIRSEDMKTWRSRFMAWRGRQATDQEIWDAALKSAAPSPIKAELTGEPVDAVGLALFALDAVLEYPEFDCDNKDEPRPICALANRAITALSVLRDATPASTLYRLQTREIGEGDWVDATPDSYYLAMRDPHMDHRFIPAPLLPQQGGEQTEEIAQAMWHRFAPDHHIEWSDETNKAEYRDAAAAIIHAVLPQEGEAKRCEYCDDTGDVHDQTGEWRGTCTCPAGSGEAKAVAPELLSKMNDALCDFAQRWKLNGDWLTCKKCKYNCIASKADQAFQHSSACKVSGIVETHPWRTLITILEPLYTSPAAQPLPVAALNANPGALSGANANGPVAANPDIDATEPAVFDVHQAIINQIMHAYTKRYGPLDPNLMVSDVVFQVCEMLAANPDSRAVHIATLNQIAGYMRVSIIDGQRFGAMYWSDALEYAATKIDAAIAKLQSGAA